jgi:peptide chain release factor 2
VQAWESLGHGIENNLELALELSREKDSELEQELERTTRALHTAFQKMEFAVFFNGKFDEHNAIISISAGAGGTDAQDWAEMLERMLMRYAEQKGFKTELADRQLGGEAGIKSSTFEIVGPKAYAWLKSEAGVHRLVRISPFDADSARHTSFALVDVIPDLGDTQDIELKDEDLRVDVFRASGHGGQSVNTTDSAVRIIHRPTNITVSVQNERSQQQNKQTALKILKSRIIQKQEQEREEAERKIRGDVKSAEWGSQIRSYVLHPYKLVKDHRTGVETSDVDSVLGGELDTFAESYVKWLAKHK